MIFELICSLVTTKCSSICVAYECVIIVHDNAHNLSIDQNHPHANAHALFDLYVCLQVYLILIMSRKKLHESYRRVNLDKWVDKHDSTSIQTTLTAEDEAKKIDSLLKKQAIEMGLSSFDPLSEHVHYEAQQQQESLHFEQELKSFAGLRKSQHTVSSSFTSQRSQPSPLIPQQHAFRPINLGIYRSAQQLEALGLEHLKHELQRLGLKCGGKLSDRAERLFMTKDVLGKSLRSFCP